MLRMSSRRRRRLDISRSARRAVLGRAALPASLRPYCVFAVEAVELLCKNGFKGHRM
jgi:hypothetical protein